MHVKVSTEPALRVGQLFTKVQNTIGMLFIKYPLEVLVQTIPFFHALFPRSVLSIGIGGHITGSFPPKGTGNPFLQPNGP